jgi:hypothetical protein
VQCCAEALRSEAVSRDVRPELTVFSCNPPPVHTFGSFASLSPPPVSVRLTSATGTMSTLLCGLVLCATCGFSFSELRLDNPSRKSRGDRGCGF